jgi:FKBP-type peptidyl-prolyl cis-trans isomerase FkpA
MTSTSLLALGALFLQQPAAPKPSPKPAPKAAARSTAPAKPAPPARKAPVTEDEKTIYALGLSIARSLKQFSLTSEELQLVKEAMDDAAAGKPQVEIETYGPKIGDLGQSRVRAASQAFLEKAAAEPGVTKTASGLLYRELQPGTGNGPKATDNVTVNYRGTFTDGTEFDSSYKTGQPASFALNHVIACWTEGLQLMKAGGKARLVCPSDLAYGDRGNQGIPGGSTLIFDVELLSVQPTP